MQQNQKFIVSNINGQYTFVKSSQTKNIANIPLNSNQLITFNDLSVYGAFVLTLDLQNSTTLTGSGTLDILVSPTGELTSFAKVFTLVVLGGLFQAPTGANVDILNNDFPNKLNHISVPLVGVSGILVRWTNATSAITDVLKLSGNINYITQA